MGSYGAFGAYGQLAYGSEPTEAEKIFDGLQSGSAGFDTSEGSDMDASNYALAMELGAMLRTLRAGYEQRHPRTATSGLPLLERKYRVPRAPSDTDDDRRKALSMQVRVARGSRREALESALRELLGEGFLGLTYPTESGPVSGMLGFERVDVPHHFWKLLTAVPTTGVALEVEYAALGRDEGARVRVGDRLYVESNNLGAYDAVVATAADPDARTFSAIFRSVHAAGVPVVTHHPYYLTGWRVVRVSVSGAVLANARLLRRVRDFLDKTLKGTTAYTLNQDAITPFSITEIDPPAVAQGVGDVPVTILGVDFPFAAVARVDNAAIVTLWLGSGQLQGTVPAAATAVPGFKTFRVVEGVRLSNAVTWAVNFPVPELEALDPLFAYVGEGGTIDVEGAGLFAVGTGVRFDVTPGSFVYGTPTEGSIVVPESVSAVAGTKTVRLENPLPGGGTSAPLDFDIRFRAPVALSLSSYTVFVGRDPGTLTITGAAGTFYPESVLKVDGVTVTSTTTSNATITFAIPSGVLATPGDKLITVTNPDAGGGGGTSTALEFTVVSPVAIALDITEVFQYFDGFDVTFQCFYVDDLFEVTYNGVPQPTTFVDENTLIAHVTTAACAVPGTTLVRARDTVTGLSSNALTFAVEPWTPNRIGPALRWWLDGTSLVNDGTGRASQWSDKSGGNRHITKPNASKRGLIVPNAVNGKTAVRLDSANQENFDTGVAWLGSGAAGIITKEAYIIWIVMRSTGTGTNQTALGETFGYIWSGGTAVAPERIQACEDTSGAALPTVLHTFTSQTYFAFRHRKVGTKLFARIDRGTEVSVTHTTNPAAFAPAAVFIGSRGASGGFLKGDVAAILVANESLNTTYLALVDNMISYEYGRPFGPAGTAPVITGVFPNEATRYDLPFHFIVEDLGGGFTASSTINVGDTPLATEFLSSTQLRARLPNTALATAGGRAITVSDFTGISAPKGITVFEFVPSSGPNLFGTGITSTVQHQDPLVAMPCYGSNFSLSSVVHANGVACPTTFVDSGELTATIPASALHDLPGAIITVVDGAATSNPLEITLTPWDPSTVEGASMWLRSDTVAVSGTNVTQWTDKLGLGHHTVQATSAKQPDLIASDPNFLGRPSIDYDGIDDCLTGAAISSLFGPTVVVLGVVFRATAITGTGAITVPYNNNCVAGCAGGNIGFALKNTPEAYAYTNDGAYQTATHPGVAVGVATCALLTCHANTINVELNRVAGTPDTFASMTIGGQIFSLGSNLAFTSNFFKGQMTEVFAATIPLSAQDAICWRNYCTWLYGTP